MSPSPSKQSAAEGSSLGCRDQGLRFQDLGFRVLRFSVLVCRGCRGHEISGF